MTIKDEEFRIYEKVRLDKDLKKLFVKSDPIKDCHIRKMIEIIYFMNERIKQLEKFNSIELKEIDENPGRICYKP